MSLGTLEVVDQYLNEKHLREENTQTIANAKTFPPAGLLTLMRAYRAKRAYARHAASQTCHGV